MLGLKKWLVLGVLLGTGCGNATSKRRKEIEDYKTTKVEVGIDSLSKRLDKCYANDGELASVKSDFSKEKAIKSWVGPLRELINLDNITDEDWDVYQQTKQRISYYFDSFYQILDKVKC